MRVIRHTDQDFAAQLARLRRRPACLIPPSNNARAILDAVAARGDEAVLEFTEKFDGAKLSAEQLAVTKEELLTASLKADAPCGPPSPKRKPTSQTSPGNPGAKIGRRKLARRDGGREV